MNYREIPTFALTLELIALAQLIYFPTSLQFQLKLTWFLVSVWPQWTYEMARAGEPTVDAIEVLFSSWTWTELLSLWAQIDSWWNISLWVAGLWLDWVHWDLLEQVVLFRLRELLGSVFDLFICCRVAYQTVSEISIGKGSCSFKLQICTGKSLINPNYLKKKNKKPWAHVLPKCSGICFATLTAVKVLPTSGAICNCCHVNYPVWVYLGLVFTSCFIMKVFVYILYSSLAVPVG